MQAHGLRVASGQHQGRALALLRADCSEDVDRTRPLIVRGAGSGSPPGPAARDLVLLADTGLVLPPQLDRGALREARGALPSIKPSGPRALNRTTQSRR